MSDDDQERIESLNEIFAAGRRVVEELHQENIQLRRRLADLEAGAGGADGAERSQRLRQLEGQYQELMQEYSDLERQNSNYLSLYVASSQIHATLVFEEVLRNIKEIIINLIGADCFSVYLYEESGKRFRRAAHEGEVDPADEIINVGDNLISRVARSGALCLDVGEADLPSGQQPIAILPLNIGSDPIGVAVLFKLLVQKEDFDAFDMELFNLLSAHAATALMSSSKYRQLENKTRTLQGLLDLFKTGA
jgi:transcriptional regulator with GAF, ATPase, and Fis domain